MAWNEPGGDGKDPWGHRKNEQGPPDLDELVKKMQEKLSGLFGGGSGGQGGDEGEPISGTAIAIIAVAALLMWSLFGFYIVQPAEVGVETRFGRYTESTSQGLNWHIPYPVEEVVKVNVEQVRAVTHKAIMLTQDENIVNIELVVQYRVSDARDYLFNVRDPDETLLQATESALREVVGTSRMDDVLTLERDRVAQDTKALVQEILDSYKTGLIVASVNMQDAQPPAEVQSAFDDVIKAREDEERSKNKAEAYSNEVVQKAGGESDSLRQQAQAYRAQVIARAEGESQRFTSILHEYEKAPAVTRQRMYIDAIESVLGNTSKVLMDVQNGGNSLVYLPLDKLMERGSEKRSQHNLSSVTQNSTPTDFSTRNDDIRQNDARSRGGR